MLKRLRSSSSSGLRLHPPSRFPHAEIQPTVRVGASPFPPPGLLPCVLRPTLGRAFNFFFSDSASFHICRRCAGLNGNLQRRACCAVVFFFSSFEDLVSSLFVRLALTFFVAFEVCGIFLLRSSAPFKSRASLFHSPR